MTLLRLLAPAGLITLLLLPIPASAQAPFDACVDRSGVPIPSKTDRKMSYAGMATYQDDKPLILWNAKKLDGAPEYEQLMVYLHECAHHTLGHLQSDRADYSRPANELEADCWAIQLLADGGMIGSFQLDSLYESESRVRGDNEHLGGDERVRALRGCLSVRTDPQAWAAALPPLIDAAQTGFVGIRGHELEAAQGRDSIWESTLGLPGTYDCEVMGTRRVRCGVFVSREQKPAVKRYQRLVEIISEWVPHAWASVESEAPKPPFAKAHHFQDPATGVALSILLLATEPKILVVTTAPIPVGTQ